ncbi:hypothetical protein RJ640_027564 [Escallonia rubra]|uniref:Uncharacterized protein n=1 Tax=Escallonia rubra TaxID=112253 RepID=A0AA88QNG6_9ASTE|nr:hypothetical protein RJ640_027564 [Escallonia rubra]
MKVRNKGKVHPSPSSSSAPPPSPPNAEAFFVMNFLPAAILALVSILSLQDREVLAYMITRSMKSTNPATVFDEKKKTEKKSGMPHKPSVFDCECFDCYTSYWFWWDSSPNHELIHQAVEAFEDHLSNGEDKSGRFDSVRFADTTSPDGKPGGAAVSQPENNVIESKDAAEEVVPVKEEASVAARGGAAVSGHKGLARKITLTPIEILQAIRQRKHDKDMEPWWEQLDVKELENLKEKTKASESAKWKSPDSTKAFESGFVVVNMVKVVIYGAWRWLVELGVDVWGTEEV